MLTDNFLIKKDEEWKQRLIKLKTVSRKLKSRSIIDTFMYNSGH